MVVVWGCIWSGELECQVENVSVSALLDLRIFTCTSCNSSFSSSNGSLQKSFFINFLMILYYVCLLISQVVLHYILEDTFSSVRSLVVLASFAGLKLTYLSMSVSPLRFRVNITSSPLKQFRSSLYLDKSLCFLLLFTRERISRPVVVLSDSSLSPSHGSVHFSSPFQREASNQTIT